MKGGGNSRLGWRSVEIPLLFIILLWVTIFICTSTWEKMPTLSSPAPQIDQACGFANGKWVVDDDDRRPFYSGSDCKRWLSPSWSCRLMHRQDFRFEKLRWQPTHCEMEEFQGSKFLERMRNKTLAFVGDSLGRQQFQSLMCMITGGDDQRSNISDIRHEFGVTLGYSFQDTNTTILYDWSSTLCDLEPLNISNPKTQIAMHLDRPPQFLRQFLHKIDVLVLNTGHHWNKGKQRAHRWVMYLNGVPKKTSINGAKNFTIHSIVKWVDSQLPHHPGLRAFYRSISPRHFVNGEWNTGGSCNNTTPMAIGREVWGSSDRIAASAVRGSGVRLLDITGLSQVRDEGHIGKDRLTVAPQGSKGGQDCLHWCLPGVPDTWNELLFAHIYTLFD